MIELTVSLVLYKNNEEDLVSIITSIKNSKVNLLLSIYDNSPDDSLRRLFLKGNMVYQHDPCNVGFGVGHNRAFFTARSIAREAKYHLIVNPDVSFAKNVLRQLILKMELEEGIGMLVPALIYSDGTRQRSARLLPKPMDFYVRRFCPIRCVQNFINTKYEIHAYDYSFPLEIPFASGCFMVFRSSIFEYLNGFDERFFMYLEDVDLSRRALSVARVILDPSIVAVHGYERGAHKNLKLMICFIASAFKYFNKWGWFFDKQRDEINKKTLDSISSRFSERAENNS